MCDKELPVVPDPVLVNTGNEEGPLKVAHEFFDKVLHFLDYDERASICFTELEYREFAYFHSKEIICPGDGMIMLIARGILVASVITRRNKANKPYFAYAHYLNEQTIEEARFRLPETKLTE